MSLPGQRAGSRTESGSIALPAFCLALLVALAVGGFCLSFNHAMVTRSELQNAADAAAIAAALDLSIAPEQADKSGLKVAAMNFADGQRVTNTGKGVKVNVDVINSDGIYPGWVKVQVAKSVVNPINGIAGIPATTVVKASSLSGVEGNTVTCFEDQLFPLAVSIDAVPMERTVAANPINSCHLGDSILLLTNAQQTRNSTFTSFFQPSSEYDYMADAIDQTLKVKPRSTGSVPRVSVGETINLSNGAFGTHYLAGGDQAAALMRHPILTLPVIEGNPQQNSSGKVVGFITLRVQGFTLSASGHELDSLRGTLIKGSLRGKTGDLPATRTETNYAALKELSAGKMKLLPANYLLSPTVSRHLAGGESEMRGGQSGASAPEAPSSSIAKRLAPLGSDSSAQVPSTASDAKIASAASSNGFAATGRSAFAFVLQPQVLFLIWWLLFALVAALSAVMLRRFFALVR